MSKGSVLNNHRRVLGGRLAYRLGRWFSITKSVMTVLSELRSVFWTTLDQSNSAPRYGCRIERVSGLSGGRPLDKGV